MNEDAKRLQRVVRTMTARMSRAGMGKHTLNTIHAFLSLPLHTHHSGIIHAFKSLPRRARSLKDEGRQFEYSMRQVIALGLAVRQRDDTADGQRRWYYDYTPEGRALFELPASSPPPSTH